MDESKIFEAISDEEILAEVVRRGLDVTIVVGSVATESAVEDEGAIPIPEVTVDDIERLPVRESLLASFDQAYQSYGLMLDTVNDARVQVKGRKKLPQLAIVDADVIRADVEVLLANEGIVAELEDELDYFTANPETNSPAPGFDIVIVPEGLNPVDEQAVATSLQAKITRQYSPYIRPTDCNDTRTPVVTGTGYTLAFAPRHYNVPKGTVNVQAVWMKTKNQQTTTIKLQTATDREALAQVSNLQATGELDNPSTRSDASYFRRFDQARDAVVDCVSSVYVGDVGKLFLGESDVRYDNSARALVVPKA